MCCGAARGHGCGKDLLDVSVLVQCPSAHIRCHVLWCVLDGACVVCVTHPVFSRRPCIVAVVMGCVSEKRLVCRLRRGVPLLHDCRPSSSSRRGSVVEGVAFMVAALPGAGVFVFSRVASTRFSVAACALCGSAANSWSSRHAVYKLPHCFKYCEETSRNCALMYRRDTLTCNPANVG